MLQILDISHQCISEDGAVAIGESLKNNNTLKELIMAKSRFTDEGIQMLMGALELNRGIKRLDLSDGFLIPSLSAIYAISSYLHNTTSLQELNLSSSRITNGLSELMKGLHENSTLHKLILSASYFDDMGPIVCTFLENNKTLLELDVSRCYIKEADLQKITEGLTENKTLQSLNVSHNSLGNSGITYFAECLQKNCTLKQLDLSDTGIYVWENNYKPVSTGIGQLCKSLKHLNISKNWIFFDELLVHSNFLGSNNTVSKLAMSICDISGSGAELIAEVNTTLRALDISHNELNDVGIIKIADSLKHNNAIQELNLSSTHMTSSGAKQIAETLYVNTALRELNISYNTLESDGVAAIAECLKKNVTLQKLDVSCCNITSKIVCLFANAIKENKGLCSFNLSENSDSDDTLKFNMTTGCNAFLQTYNLSRITC